MFISNAEDSLKDLNVFQTSANQYSFWYFQQFPKEVMRSLYKNAWTEEQDGGRVGNRNIIRSQEFN